MRPRTRSPSRSVYTNARSGAATLDPEQPGTDLRPLFETLLEDRRSAAARPGSSTPGLGHQPRLQPVRRAPRAVSGHARHHRPGPERDVVPHRRHEHDGKRSRSCNVTESLDRVRRRQSRTRRDHRRRRDRRDHHRRKRLPTSSTRRRCRPITVDEPSLSMTIGTKHLALGRAGRQEGPPLASSRNRLDAELVGNVSIRVVDTERPRHVGGCRGRGELQLAVLVEIMRREGFEMTVRQARGADPAPSTASSHEPTERVTIDIPEAFVGSVDPAPGRAQGQHGEHVPTTATGWVRLDYIVPAPWPHRFSAPSSSPRPRGTGLMSHVFEGYTPWLGELRTRPLGFDRPRTARALSWVTPWPRSKNAPSLLVAPGTAVYAGMVVGEKPPPRRHGRQHLPGEEADQHSCRRCRRHSPVLTPPRILSARAGPSSFIADDECGRGDPRTPSRIRKVTLDANQRGRARKRLQRARD